MIKHALVVSTFLIIAAPLSATQTLAVDISADRMSQDVKVLASDAYEGRAITTPAEAKVIDYISNGFRQAGLQPGGNHGSWVQDVHLRKFEVSNATVALGLSDGSSLALHNGTDIVISTRGTTSNVLLEKTPVVFVGYGIEAPERGWNDFKDADVKGKILVELVNDPDFSQPELNTFNGKAMTYYGRWTYKYEEAARKGAAGVLIVHDEDAASYGWDTVRNSWSAPQYDIVRTKPASASPLLEAWISHDMAARLFKAAGLDLASLRVKARAKDFQPVLMNVVLNASYDVHSSEIITHNVVGRIEGSKYPDETVLYSAHWDHFGYCAEGKDKICNGAVDNGTGVAALMELARAFGRSPPERSVIFISFTAEESGLLGSEYYATNPLTPLAKTVAGINMDALNVNGRSRDIEVIGAGQSSLDTVLKPLAAQQGRVLTADARPEAGHFFRSDHFPLVKRGVPMLDAGSGEDLVKGGKAAGKAANDDYVAKRYHQPGDEWSAQWDLSGMVEDVTLFYEIGNQLANSRDWPVWSTTSEFKAARDTTAADRH